MRIIDTKVISCLEPVPGGSGDWYYGMDYRHGDLYEAEEIYKNGKPVTGRKLCLVHYPDGQVFFPVPEMEGHYNEGPVFLSDGIYIADVDFPGGLIRIMRFDCIEHITGIYAELPLASVKDCYNLKLHITPLTLTRQCVGTNEFEIVWPEKVSFSMDDHDSFFLRDGEKLFFSRWHEEGEGEDYRYWEETIVRDLEGTVLETLPGDVMRMPNGEMWNIK